jgi:uncharacterized protein (TIGR03435 family)
MTQHTSRNPKPLGLFSSLYLTILLFLATAALTRSSLAQTPPPAAPPSFDAASIRAAQQCNTGYSTSPSGSRLFSITNVSMAFLIEMAYSVGDDQLEKNPSWIETECYSITARAEGEGSLPDKQLHLLLQSLLAQRFHLALHSAMKDVSGYAMVVAKDGPKLDPTKGGPATGNIDLQGLRARNFSTGSLASVLPRAVRAHVIDQTGLTGRYDINLSFSLDVSGAPTDSALPSIFTALQQQLGLKLIPQKIPVKMLIVDHVDKVPTEN